MSLGRFKKGPCFKQMYMKLYEMSEKAWGCKWNLAGKQHLPKKAFMLVVRGIGFI